MARLTPPRPAHIAERRSGVTSEGDASDAPVVDLRRTATKWAHATSARNFSLHNPRTLARGARATWRPTGLRPPRHQRSHPLAMVRRARRADVRRSWTSSVHAQPCRRERPCMRKERPRPRTRGRFAPAWSHHDPSGTARTCRAFWRTHDVLAYGALHACRDGPRTATKWARATSCASRVQGWSRLSGSV